LWRSPGGSSLQARKVTGPFGPEVSTFWTLITGLAFVAAIVDVTFNLRNLLHDLIIRRVRIVSGQGRLQHHSRGRGSRYCTLDIKGYQFKIPDDATKAIADDENYTVYYAPHSKIILAIEIEDNTLTTKSKV
jgi:hypothetical protein